ncbi:carboxypeptidase-like regulatory domain-containing protein [Kaistella sp. G5-32]|uniref:Carboxypeptidase-like regulatory domain-containing protein n=1 Tax=Kaistella gelatinilytica TaxID=2787636 RepID=A0ABS0FBL3_9FLAO|nr:carboxypeptidase-like regulatory domain-containing protein [Kaistella gelatinilytica]MBF8457100.1 carboxypeptidase-like regulatory domain-containing protein [Kaistella gelatinilytica]
MNKAPLLFLLFFGFLMNAQIIAGKILSKEENQPIPYAKIGIDNHNAGSIADDKGNFKIDLTAVDQKKNLQVEVGGFEKFTISVEKFLKQNPQTIFLVEKVKDIEEVKINPAKFDRKNWGITTKTKRIMIGHNPSKESGDQSKEVAMLFKTNKKTKIEKININISSFESDKPVFIRFTVYDRNLNPILTEDLHDEITSDKIIDDTYNFDVSKNNIWVKDNFYVGIQLLSNFNGRFYMSGALMGNKTIYRKYLGEWQNIPMVSPAINLDVKVQK